MLYEVITYASLADVSEGESVIYTAAAADNDGGVIINSTAGVVDIDNMASATLLTNTVETADGYNSTFTSSGELAQVFEFIEVPLYRITSYNVCYTKLLRKGSKTQKTNSLLFRHKLAETNPPPGR